MKIKPDQLAQIPGFLKSIALFAGCTEAHLQALASNLEYFQYPKGKVLIMEQEISMTLYVLKKGSVGVYKRVSGAKKLIATLQAPNFFGETSMFMELPATALVKIEEDADLYTLSRQAFDAVCQKQSDLSALIHKTVEIVRAQRPVITAPKPEE